MGSALVAEARRQADNSSNHLVLWRKIVVALQGLMAIVKIQEAKANLVAFLRVIIITIFHNSLMLSNSLYLLAFIRNFEIIFGKRDAYFRNKITVTN